MTFSNRHTQYAYFIESTINEKPTNEIYEKLKEFKEFNENELVQTEALTTKTGGTKLLGVLPTNPNDEKHQAVIGHGNIKLFEPIVIQCLKVRQFATKYCIPKIFFLFSFFRSSLPNPIQRCNRLFLICCVKCLSLKSVIVFWMQTTYSLILF